MILVITNPTYNISKHFLVSSKVLSLVLPVFSKIFSPDFSKGLRIRREDRLYINLDKDDPKAMESLLRILYFQYTDDISFLIEPKPLVVLTVYYNKYDYIIALRLWIA